MDWGDIHIVTSYNYPDSTILAEDRPTTARPTRSTHKPLPKRLRPTHEKDTPTPGLVQYLPGVPLDKYGIPIPGSAYAPMPAGTEPKSFDIKIAATDEGGVRDSTAMATTEEQDAASPPLTPPTLTRQTAEESFSPPHIHSRLDFAPFAASAYEAVDERESFMSDFTGKNAYYSYIQRESNQEVATYMGSDGSLVFAIRGTATTGDAVTDRSILAGNPLKTPRFRRNIQMINRISAKLGVSPNNIVLTGHSLGGSIAAAGAVALGVKAVTFNAGFSPASILRDPYAREGKYKSSDITNYVVPGDLVSFSSSMLPLLPETYTIRQTAAGGPLTAPHKMSNFLNQLGDFKTQRGDLYAPGMRTEGRVSNVADGWISVPKKVPATRKTDSGFHGRIGEPLPVPPTLWQTITGRDPPKPVSDIDRIARLAGTIRDLTNVFRPPRLDIPEYGEPIDYPTLDLGPDEPLSLEEGLEDILGYGEEFMGEALELGLVPP